jgi:hypothetical protein
MMGSTMYIWTYVNTGQQTPGVSLAASGVHEVLQDFWVVTRQFLWGRTDSTMYYIVYGLFIKKDVKIKKINADDNFAVAA